MNLNAELSPEQEALQAEMREQLSAIVGTEEPTVSYDLPNYENEPPMYEVPLLEPSPEELAMMEERFTPSVPIEESEDEFMRRVESEAPPYDEDYYSHYDESNIPPEESEYDVYPEMDYGNVHINAEQIPPDMYDNSMPPPEPPRPQRQRDDSILIDSEMITGRKTYSIKEDYIDDLIDKIFERLDIPAIQFEVKAANVREITVEAGANEPPSLALVTTEGIEEVPLGEHEQETLENAINEFERTNDKEK